MKITRINSIKTPKVQILSVQRNTGSDCLQQQTGFAPSFEGGLSPRVYLDKIKALKKEMLAFPRDIEYRKNLMINAGKSPEEAYKIRSIIGLDEIKSIMADFNENEIAYSVGKDDENVINKTMRANLHIHTLASDGIAPVKERLDQAASYADEVAKNPAFKKEPFTIAITDHDTTDGIKEAIEIISSDPVKYRNLRVILGVEMTTFNNIATNLTKEPTNTHILIYGIDPNDKTFGGFITNIKQKKYQIASKMIEHANSIHKKAFATDKALFSTEQVQDFYNPLKKRILGVYNYIVNYVETKTILNEVVLKSPSLVKKVEENNLPLNADELMRLMKDFYYPIDGNNKTRKALESIPQFLAQKIGLEPDKIKELIQNAPQSPKVVEFIHNCKTELEQYKVTLTSKCDYMPSIKDIFEGVKDQEHAIVGIAHPLKTAKKLAEPKQRYEFLVDLYNQFKQAGKEKAGFSEAYYQSYSGELKDFKEAEATKKLLNSLSQDFAFYKTGSLDSHGATIFGRY